MFSDAVGCYHLHPPLPFNSTQPKSQYSLYRVFKVEMSYYDMMHWSLPVCMVLQCRPISTKTVYLRTGMLNYTQYALVLAI